MRVLIVAGVMLITAIFVGVGGASLIESPDWLVNLFFAFGAGLGLLLGSLLLRLITPKRKAPTSRRDSHREVPAIPFPRRLSRFMSVVHTADEDGDRSPMPIWSLRQNDRRTPPKSQRFIRQILMRIRAILSRG
ncbi:hypothetical protein [Novipirellula maiorica]|nr:hypothetical protein [Rhodopirellula maiorica]